MAEAQPAAYDKDVHHCPNPFFGEAANTGARFAWLNPPLHGFGHSYEEMENVLRVLLLTLYTKSQ